MLITSPLFFIDTFVHFRDRFRTLTNVTGDSLGAGIVYHLSKDELPPIEEVEMAGVQVNEEQNPGKVPNGTEGADIAAVWRKSDETSNPFQRLWTVRENAEKQSDSLDGESY